MKAPLYYKGACACLWVCGIPLVHSGNDTEIFMSQYVIFQNGLDTILPDILMLGPVLRCFIQETAVEGEQLLRASVKLRERMYGFMGTGTERLNLAFNLQTQVGYEYTE